MKNYKQPGEILTLTAPTGGVVSGYAYLIGALLVVAQVSAAEGALFSALTRGVVTLPKATGSAWTEGEKLFWDNTNKRFTDTSATGLFPAGVATAAAASGDAVGDVLLTGIPLTAV